MNESKNLHSSDLEPEIEAEQERDISNPEVQRALLHEQDPVLLKAVSEFAAKVYSCPPDPQHPELQPRALVIGGFVRDALLGGHPKDVDIEVMGLSPERLIELLEQLFPGKVGKVGQQFGLLKVDVAPGIEFDVSIPRTESKSGTGHKGFITNSDPTMSVKEAARRRDFTWNSLAADILTGEVFDHYGGIQDLKDKVLRVTDAERFVDDPLRVMRAVQFAARLNFKIEPESFKLMSDMVARGELNELPPERITAELEKLLLKAERPSIGFEAARELGIIEKHFPEMHALIGVQQEKQWHPEGDVWVHEMMVTDAAAKIIRQAEREFTNQEKIQVMLGALGHDFGKALVTEFKDGRWRAHGHEEAGRKPAKEFCTRLKFGQDVTDAMVTVAVYHLQPPQLYSLLLKGSEDGGLDEKKYANAVRRLVTRLGQTSWKVLLACAEADSRGRTIPGCDVDPYLPGEMMAKVITEQKLDTVGVKKLIRGEDIQAIAAEFNLDIKPGIVFGKLISAIEELRDNGEVTTHEEGVERLRELIKVDYNK